MHTTGELETAQGRAAELERAALAHRRSELARDLWLPDLCDISMTLRTSQTLVLTGLRMPRVPTMGQRGAGLSPGLGVLRQIGEPTSKVGGGQPVAPPLPRTSRLLAPHPPSPRACSRSISTSSSHIAALPVQGRWAALGGSLLWDAREREIASMRLALCAQPAADQLVSLSFDHTGGLTGSVKTQRDSMTARLFGTLDLNRKGGSRAGVELIYDLPE